MVNMPNMQSPIIIAKDISDALKPLFDSIDREEE